MTTREEILDHAPNKAEVIKMVQRITKAIGKADSSTVFVACAMIMQVQSDLLGIGMKNEPRRH